MSIWALSDLHLALSVPAKTMEVFSPVWKGYIHKIETHWREAISSEDLVLLPGDLCWAMRLEEALIDLQWLDKLPGTKLLLKGNHDYWWSSSSKMRKALPPSIHFIHNDVFFWKGIAIGGSRLWDTPEYNFGAFTVQQDNPKERVKTLEEMASKPEEDEKIFLRELERLRLSLSQLPKEASHRIAMTHYPPIGANLAPSRASQILEAFQIEICVFGHLHSIQPHSLPFGTARGIDYKFTSCDYLNFKPVRIL